jgi:DNA-binding PadR family transcriptional regulator
MAWIQESSGGLDLEEGALYPALHRMEERGWLESEWGRSDSNRRAKFYRLTRRGGRQLSAKTTEWRGHVAAIDRVLAAT